MDPASIWEGEGLAARGTRALLAPFGWLYRAGVAGRNAGFDLGLLRSRPTAVPAISVGNLSVGGTGKTPVAADLARRLVESGGHPALVLRGYGDDEPAVHAILNPDVPVLTSPDRVAASAEARARGCDVVVLDDAFQHRWARRVVDVVLVAAEQWRIPLRLLPAGPYREPASSLRRASLVVITRKTATAEQALAVRDAVTGWTAAPTVNVAFHLDVLRRVGESRETRPVSSLRGEIILAVTGIGAPHAFARQLESVGGSVSLVSFPDHHRFTASDVTEILRRAPQGACIVCTLKDAVKLEALWPRASAPLWYVSQRLTLESGEPAYHAAIRQVLDARSHDRTLR
jgi:tetraacyldisaccharide 4'-kinase